MMKSKTIKIDKVGLILFEYSKRAKHLNISIKPFTGVRVAVPYRVSFKKAKEFTNSNINWIQKNLSKMKQVEQEYNSIGLISSNIDRAKAKITLVNRLSELAEKHGFNYNKVFIKNQKTLWGSCSPKNNINLNMKLLKLPVELIDYVILHELVHTRINNHSRRFWAELNRFLGDAKRFDRQLKNYKIELL